MGLIKHFGGVYVDFTTILTEPLDWLLNIENEPLITNKYGKNPDLILLYSYHSEKDTHYDE